MPKYSLVTVGGKQVLHLRDAQNGYAGARLRDGGGGRRWAGLSHHAEIGMDAVNGMLHVRTRGRFLQKHVVVVSVLILTDLARKTAEMKAKKGQMMAVALNGERTFLLILEPFHKNIVPLREERYTLTCTPDGGEFSVHKIICFG